MKRIHLLVLCMLAAFALSANGSLAQEIGASAKMAEEGPARCSLVLNGAGILALPDGAWNVAADCRTTCSGVYNGIPWSNSCGTSGCRTCIQSQCSRTYCRAGCATAQRQDAPSRTFAVRSASADAPRITVR